MKRSIHLLVILCAALVAACASDTSEGATGNTELNLDIVNPGGTSGELGFAVDRVDYRITCAGNAPGSYPIPDADTSGTDYNYNDSVDISGAFEVVDTRVPPVWQAVMDLPPGNCTVTLSVYEDDEIVCVGSQTLAINEDATTKYDIVLVCSLSIDTPDGMADIDGSFEFITANVCPKLYILNAIQSYSDLLLGRTAIQYRAKDPDNSCGDNCDPQTCDFSNPPVCTPSPYNPNDPLCNPLAGGNPNSAACQSSGAGLVCTVAAWPSASNPGGPLTGAPGGTFISPADGTTSVGPVLPVNLNTAASVPGIILPGLGGPAGTNAANSPAYPPLPNVNGSLSPLLYECDTLQPGPTYITVSCSDGDAECDQLKQIIVECGVGDFCIGEPVICSGSGQCLTNGVCDNSCDPSRVPPCERCPGRDLPRPPGTICSEGGGNVCDGLGNCVECLTGTNCLSTFPPVDCQLPPTCTGGSCQAGGAAPAGTPCSNGVCDGSGIGAGACQFVPIDPPELSRVITVSCTNNLSGDLLILPFVLTVDPGAILANQGFTAGLGGLAEFPELFLDAAQLSISGGLTAVNLVDAAATVQVRQGASGADVTLTGGTSLPYECILDDAGAGAQQVCDPANDLPSIPGLRGNTDCLPVVSQNPCGRVVEIPTSSDCSLGGVCDVLGKGPGTLQCDSNGFCVTGGLPLPLDAAVGAYTADTSGEVSFGWADNPPNPQAVGTPPVLPNGTWNMVSPIYSGVVGELGIAVTAAGLGVQLECIMAVDSGGPNGTTPPVPDKASPTPTGLLTTFNVQVP